MDLTIPPMNAALQRQVDEKLRNLGPFPSDQQVADVNPEFAARRALDRLLSAERILADAQARHPDDSVVIATYASYRDGCLRVFRAAVDWLNARNEEAERLEKQTAEEAAQEAAQRMVRDVGVASAIESDTHRLKRLEHDAAWLDGSALHEIQQDIAETQARLAALRAMQQEERAA